MALRDLSTETMLAISGTWLDREGDRPKLETDSVVKAYLGRLEVAHEGLRSHRSLEGDLDKQIASLIKRTTALDQRHDRKARAIYGALTAAVNLTDDLIQRKDYREAQRVIFPEGLSIVQCSYLEEAGAVEALAARSTPEVREKLAQIRFRDVGLDQVLDEWIEAGRELGRAQLERMRLERQDDKESVVASDIYRSRLVWIRTVNSMIDLLAISQVPPNTRDELLAGLRSAQ